MYEKRAAYERPVIFTELGTPPHDRHLLQIKTTLHAPVSRNLVVDADECKSVVVPLFIRYRIADRNGRRIPFPLYEELEENGLSDVKAVLRPLAIIK